MSLARAALPILAILLAACSTVQWSREGASEADVARDLADCRKEASSRYPITAALPSSSPDPRFAGPVGPSPADRQMQIQMSVTSCMRARGYALIPASG